MDLTPMQPPIIETASADDADRVMRTIALGFIGDPVARWMWPDAETYLDVMPKFAAAFGGKAIEHGAAYVAAGYKAAALWLPPGVESDEEKIEALLEATIAPEIGDDVSAIFEQMDECHPSAENCWYLPLIAADPAFVGQGLGAAIMKHALQRCDEDGAMAYLESSNPRNISLYERHGFEIVGKIQAGSSPVLTPMIREPIRR